MAEYEIRISGVHYGANGDSVAGQKDTEEMHVRTRELLSRIDRVRPIVTLFLLQMFRTSDDEKREKSATYEESEVADYLFQTPCEHGNFLQKFCEHSI